MRLALRLTGDWFAAEDVASETFARVFARWSKVRGLEYREAWTMRVASNLAIDAVRRHGRLDRGFDSEAEVADPAEVAVLRVGLVAALAALPKSQREAVVLRYLADLPETDVAEVLGIAPGTVKSHLHRARSALGRRWDPELGGA